MPKVNKKVQFPENLKVKKVLRYGDAKRLAADSDKYTYGAILNILSGHRRMTDSLARDVVKLLRERKKLNAELERQLS